MRGLPAIFTNLPHGLQPPNVLLWCRRLRAAGLGVVEERRLAPVALERVHDVPLGLRDLPQFRNEGACVPPYYRASPLHGGRVQGDLLKTRAKACTSEDLQLNAGAASDASLSTMLRWETQAPLERTPQVRPSRLTWEGSPPDACREEAQSPPATVQHFFLSAGRRGRCSDPQALGPPHHPLGY